MKDYFCMWLQYYILFFWDFSGHKQHFLWEIFNLHFVPRPSPIEPLPLCKRKWKKLEEKKKMSSSDRLIFFFSFLCELKKGKKREIFPFHQCQQFLVCVGYSQGKETLQVSWIGTFDSTCNDDKTATTVFFPMFFSPRPYSHNDCVLTAPTVRMWGGGGVLLLWWEDDGEVWNQAGRRELSFLLLSHVEGQQWWRENWFRRFACFFSSRLILNQMASIVTNACQVRGVHLVISHALLLLTPPLGSLTRPYARPLSYNAAF